MSLFDIESFTDGTRDKFGILWCRSTYTEVNPLLSTEHYLGPRTSGQLVFAGINHGGRVVAAQVWGTPSSKFLPNDGTWLELARWCLTPQAGPSAGSRQHRHTVRWLRRHAPNVTTLVSYSDPSRGHTGTLYRACNWEWWPTWHRLSPPPTGNGRWTSESDIQSVKDRWVFPVTLDSRRATLLKIDPDQAGRTLRSALSSTLHPWQRIALERQLSAPAEDGESHRKETK